MINSMSIRGKLIHVETFGEESSPAVLFLHGRRVRAVTSLYYTKPRGLQLNYLLSPSTREEFAVPRESWKKSLLDFMISLKIVKSLGVSSVSTPGRLSVTHLVDIWV